MFTNRQCDLCHQTEFVCMDFSDEALGIKLMCCAGCCEFAISSVRAPEYYNNYGGEAGLLTVTDVARSGPAKPPPNGGSMEYKKLPEIICPVCDEEGLWALAVMGYSTCARCGYFVIDLNEEQECEGFSIGQEVLYRKSDNRISAHYDHFERGKITGFYSYCGKMNAKMMKQNSIVSGYSWRERLTISVDGIYPIPQEPVPLKKRYQFWR